jgi:hypothetical protein
VSAQVEGASHVQVSLDITSSGLDEGSGTGTVSGNYNLISDMVSQHVLVAREDVNSLDVKVQKVRRPRGGASIYESAFSTRSLRVLVEYPPIDPLTGNERSILNAGRP